MSSPDEIRDGQIRDGQRAAWAGLSAGWAKWDAVIMDQLGPVGTVTVDGLGIAEDQHHLDIASGTGEPGLSIARLGAERAGRADRPGGGDAGRGGAASRGAGGRQH
jgi:hypothetical protein